MSDQAEAQMSPSQMEVLICIPIFESLDPEELKIVTEFLSIEETQPKQIIFREGDRGDYVCFVVDGTLDVLKRGEGGQYVVLSSLHRGRSIGEMAILDHFPRSATVRSRTKSTLVTLSRDSFNEIMHEHPRIGIMIVRGIARLLSLALRKTSTRLADYMLPLG